MIAYLLWQFVRGAKYCRIPYALLVHTFMWIIGRWGRPLAWKNYLVLETGREKFYVAPGGAENRILSECVSRTDRYRVDVSRPDEAPDLVVISIPAANYKLCLGDARKNESFVWNYLRDRPECVARVADLLLPNLAILDRISDLEGLRMMCQGDYIPCKRSERFLAMPDRKHELNPNFMRLLSTVPLMAQAKGYEGLSVWISVTVLLIDQLSLVCNWVWRGFKRFVFYVVTVPMTQTTYFQPRTREALCAFFSAVSTKLKWSDQVRRNLVKVKKGDLVYTMYSRFNLANFEKITVREFTRKRKTPRPYSKEKFGMFTSLGDELDIAEGTPIITHYVDGSRIDSIFHDDGSFFNFRNNEAIHLGCWKLVDAKDSKDSKHSKDSEDSEDSKDSENAKDSKDSKHSKDSEDSKDSKDSENAKDSKDSKHSKDSEDSKDSKDSENAKDSKDSKHSKGSEDSEDSRDSENAKDSEDSKESKDSKDSEDAKNFEDAKHSKDSEDNYNNLQDLLQIMEEMQMLPLRQTDDGDFRSVDFNMFVCPGASLKNLTFLVAKKTAIIGG